jgi:hypothetical protein
MRRSGERRILFAEMPSPREAQRQFLATLTALMRTP